MTKLLLAISALFLVLSACASDDPAVAPEPTEDALETETTEANGAATLQVVDSDHGEILADGDGNTLYVFLKDDADVSTCSDACAETWPPLTVEGDPEAGDDVDAELIGTIERDDGSTQLTYDRRPLYLYSGDEAPGDTNGQGVGDNWFVVDPEGEPVRG